MYIFFVECSIDARVDYRENRCLNVRSDPSFRGNTAGCLTFISPIVFCR